MYAHVDIAYLLKGSTSVWQVREQKCRWDVPRTTPAEVVLRRRLLCGRGGLAQTETCAERGECHADDTSPAWHAGGR